MVQSMSQELLLGTPWRWNSWTYNQQTGAGPLSFPALACWPTTSLNQPSKSGVLKGAQMDGPSSHLVSVSHLPLSAAKSALPLPFLVLSRPFHPIVTVVIWIQNTLQRGHDSTCQLRSQERFSRLGTDMQHKV